MFVCVFVCLDGGVSDVNVLSRVKCCCVVFCTKHGGGSEYSCARQENRYMDPRIDLRYHALHCKKDANHNYALTYTIFIQVLYWELLEMGHIVSRKSAVLLA